MTDEKVKEAVERLTRIARLVEHRGVADAVVKVKHLRVILSDHDALQAERDKLAGEVEASHQRFVDANEGRLDAEAKLTALVEALTDADGCFEAAYAEGLLDVLAASDDANLCDLVNRRILMAREPIWRALAHHSAPVGEDQPPSGDWLRYSRLGIRASCADCGCDYDKTMACDLVIPRDQWLKINPADGGVLCANCLLRRAAALPGAVNVTGRITTGDDNLETYQLLSAPPSTSTSAPVEDVGGLVETLKFYRDNWTVFAVGDEGDGVTDLGRLDGYEMEPNAALKKDGGYRARQALDRPPTLGWAAAMHLAAGEARRYAGFYKEASDGRNTFIILAEWAEKQAAALSPALIQPQGGERS